MGRANQNCRGLKMEKIRMGAAQDREGKRRDTGRVRERKYQEKQRRIKGITQRQERHATHETER